MPILLEFLSQFSPGRAIEYGSGLFSTKALIDLVPDVMTVETESREWFDYLEERYGHFENWRHLFAHGGLLIVGNTWDLCLVDDGPSRLGLTHLAFTLAPVVICHDTQYDWIKEVDVPPEFSKIDFVEFPARYDTDEEKTLDDRPWTTLFTSDGLVHEHFSQIEESNLYAKYRFPYGIIKPCR
jgi:hypothetical protein